LEAGENRKQVFSGSHTRLEISQTARDSHFPTAPTAVPVFAKRKAKANCKAKPKPKAKAA